MEIAIIAIIALVGAWLLVKNYDKIDTALFGQNNPDYEPSGRPVVGISLLRRVPHSNRLPSTPIPVSLF